MVYSSEEARHDEGSSFGQMLSILKKFIVKYKKNIPHMLHLFPETFQLHQHLYLYPGGISSPTERGKWMLSNVCNSGCKRNKLIIIIIKKTCPVGTQA